MNNELPKRGGAHTFEQLEAEVLAGQQAANKATLRGADMTAEKEIVPKADAKPEAAGKKSGE